MAKSTTGPESTATSSTSESPLAAGDPLKVLKPNELRELVSSTPEESPPGKEYFDLHNEAKTPVAIAATDPCTGIRIGDTVYYWINASESSPPVAAIVTHVGGHGILDLSVVMPRYSSLEPKLGVPHKDDARLGVSKFHREKGCWGAR